MKLLSATAAAIVVSVWVSPVRAETPLSAREAGVLKAAEGALKTADTNLKAAESAAGPPGQTVPVSRARLALTRAASARSYVDAAAKAIEPLPADNAQVKAFRAKLDETRQAIDALEKRLTGPVVPKVGIGTKLDFKQEKLLKDADFHLRFMEGATEPLTKFAEQVKAAPDPDRLDYNQLRQASATIAKSRERKGYVEGYLKELPPAGMGVPLTAERLKNASAGIDAADKVIAPAEERIRKLLDPAGYPSLNEDVKRLQGLSLMFSQTRAFENNPALAAELVTVEPAAKEELARVLKAYGPLLFHQSEAGKPIAGAAAGLTERFKEFDALVNESRRTVPAAIRADLGKAEKLAEEAVGEQKPLYFRGGIPQHLDRAHGNLVLCAALDPEAAKALRSELAETEKRIRLKQASLRAQIIAENPLPPDRYTGADRAALIAQATAAWKKQQGDAEVLAVRIPSEQWTRKASWQRVNSTWYYSDGSTLQVQLLVKFDDKLAVVRPVNLWADHLKNEAITANPLHSIKDEPTPESLLAIEKIK